MPKGITNIKEKPCPLLEGFGIDDMDSQGGRTICKHCPIWDEKTKTGYCVFDKWDNGEDVSEEDWNKLVEVRDKIWEVLAGVSNAE